jgi:steroid delta-isomerase-like uncharacterized protein
MASAQTANPAEARERLVGAYLEAWNSHDPDAVAALFADDGVYDDRGAAEIARGREEIRAHVARVQAGFEDLRFELVRAAHGEDFTAGEWRCRMTHTGQLAGLWPTGRTVESAGVDVATLDAQGSIAHLVSYYDGAAIMRSLGLLPAHGSRLERALVGLASAPRRALARATRAASPR